MTYIEYLNAFNQWLEDDNPTDKAVILYYAMLDMFNRRGWPRWAGVDTRRLMALARATNKPTAIRARDALVEAGFLDYRRGRKGKATEYRLLKYGNKIEPESVTESVTTNVTESVTTNVTPNKNKTKTKTKNTPHSPPVNPDGLSPELQNAFSDWLSYKRERREAYKPTGLRSLIAEVQNNAREYGDQAVADLIRKCMANNWRGIIFDRLKNGQAKPEKAGNVFMDMLREEQNGAD